MRNNVEPSSPQNAFVHTRSRGLEASMVKMVGIKIKINAKLGGPTKCRIARETPCSRARIMLV